MKTKMTYKQAREIVQRLHDKYCAHDYKNFHSWVEKQRVANVYVEHCSPKSKYDMWCPYCGTEFTAKDKKGNVRKTCPHCHRGISISRYYSIDTKSVTKFFTYEYYEQVTTCKGWQISRVWLGDWLCHKGERMRLDRLVPVYERWFNPEHHQEVLLGKYIGMFPYARRIPWALTCWDTYEMQVHSSLAINDREYSYGYYGHVSQYINDSARTYPKMQLLPYFEKNLQSCDYSQIRKEMSFFFRALNGKKNYCALETILKVGSRAEIKLMVIDTEAFKDYWATILIARRHHYDYARYGREYFDYLYQLSQLKFDLRNPKYVCPADFNAMHQQMTEKLNRIAEKERKRRQIEAELARAEEERKREEERERARKSYRQRFGWAFGIAITNEHFSATPLKSVQEFCDEGIAMHHCVFSGGYYDIKHKNSLILSVRTADGRREATVELKTNTWQIAQCYTLHDKISEWDGEIREMILNAVPMIQQAYKSRNKKSTTRATA